MFFSVICIYSFRMKQFVVFFVFVFLNKQLLCQQSAGRSFSPRRGHWRWPWSPLWCSETPLGGVFKHIPSFRYSGCRWGPSVCICHRRSRPSWPSSGTLHEEFGLVSTARPTGWWQDVSGSRAFCGPQSCPVPSSAACGQGTGR